MVHLAKVSECGQYKDIDEKEALTRRMENCLEMLEVDSVKLMSAASLVHNQLRFITHDNKTPTSPRLKFKGGRNNLL